jgi:predicted transcriptional regulator
MRIKKEYKTLIPPLSPEEYQYLEENILKDGVREPLVVWGDILIDGHNRYEICQKHGITYKTVNKDFESDEEAERWIILNQFGRRNLTKFQRSELALKLKPMLAAQAKERQKIYCGNQYDKKRGLRQNSVQVQKGKTSDDIAKIAGVSRDTISKVSVIQEKGSPEQIQRARTGGKGNTVNAIYHEITTKSKETKVCNKCGNEKPADEFYAGKNVCKQCRNKQKRMAKPITDFKGDVTATMDDKIKNADVDSIINSLYDTNTPVELTSDDLAEDILCVVSNFAGDIDRCIEEYDVTITEENGKKIKAALEKAEAAIQKMKGNINYE